MEKKEIEFEGFKMNGFLGLLLMLVLLLIGIWGFYCAATSSNETPGICLGILAILLLLFMACGFILLEPNQAEVMLFFGRYRGTFRDTGFYWVNPLLTAKKVSLRARNLNPEPIKVNDKEGNPIMIGLVMVWRLKDTYKAMFEIDSQTISSASSSMSIYNMAVRMNSFQSFVNIQSDAALREVAGLFSYDNNNDSDSNELTLRAGGEEINKQLEEKLNERMEMSGLEVIEARINYIAYAPEIASVMLRRQQASAVIMAREKIVDGAVSMVKMALDKLSSENIVELDDDKKAAMVSNLMVVLCADEPAQPVINSGTLNH